MESNPAAARLRNAASAVGAFFARAGRAIEQRRQWRVAAILLILLVTFLGVFLLNALTPVDLGDDAKYRCVVGAEQARPIRSVGDVVASLRYCYLHDNPRLPYLALNILSVLLPAAAFDLINAAVYTVFVLLICAHVSGGRRLSPGLLAAASAASFLLLPAFGETCLWVSGSCMYLWTTTCVLGFLLPYARALRPGASPARNAALAVAMLPLGLLAGWSNFNTGGVAALFAAAAMLLLGYRKQRLPASGMASCLAGVLLLVCAPAIAETRFSVSGALPSVRFSGGSGLLQTLFSVVNKVHISYAAPIAAGVSLTILCTLKRDARDVAPAFLYALCGVAGTAACLLTTGIPLRALHISITMLLIAALYPIGRLAETPRLLRRVLAVFALLMLPYLTFTFGRAAIDLKSLRDISAATVTFDADGVAHCVDEAAYAAMQPRTRYNMYFPGDIWE